MVSNEPGPEKRKGPPPTPDELPVGLALITSAAGGRRTVMAANQLVVVPSDPMIVTLAARHDCFSYDLIKESGEFVVNTVTKEMASITMRAGQDSGRSMDKFAAYGLETKQATHVGAPLIVGCPCSMECKIFHEVDLGNNRTVYFATVLALHIMEGEARPLVSYKHRFIEIGDTIPLQRP